MEQVRDKPKGKLASVLWYVRDVAMAVQELAGVAAESAGHRGRRSKLLERLDPSGSYASDDDFVADHRGQQQAIGELLGAAPEALVFDASYIRRNLRNVRDDDGMLADALERLTHAEVKLAETEQELALANLRIGVYQEGNQKNMAVVKQAFDLVQSSSVVSATFEKIGRMAGAALSVGATVHVSTLREIKMTADESAVVFREGKSLEELVDPDGMLADAYERLVRSEAWVAELERRQATIPGLGAGISTVLERIAERAHVAVKMPFVDKTGEATRYLTQELIEIREIARDAKQPPLGDEP